jgi:hypothetical protein
VESIDVSYVPFLPIINSITVTGRGVAKIKIAYIGHIQTVREFADNFCKLQQQRYDKR